MHRKIQLLTALLLLTLTFGPLVAQDEDMSECPAPTLLTEDENLFASIRRYEGVDPADYPEINQRVAAVSCRC